KRPFGNPVPVSDLATEILDPVLRKRAGISIGLVQSWEEIAGPRLAIHSRPEKIQWPRRLHEDDPFEPAVLVIACEGMAALHLQHETGEIINRVNAFLGFTAIGRIRIV
ncbi:DciA family protein, partial [Mesorhizobium sp. M4B.F.Ca.ET.214.01.1.1]